MRFELIHGNQSNLNALIPVRREINVMTVFRSLDGHLKVHYIILLTLFNFLF